jgi:hypothetical protein
LETIAPRNYREFGTIASGNYRELGKIASEKQEVSGHDFSRADNLQPKKIGLQPLRAFIQNEVSS